MPVPPRPVSRRELLRASASACLGTIVSGCASRNLDYATGSPGAEGEALSSDRWVLLSDTHIAGDVRTRCFGANMANNLAAAVRSISVSHKSGRPACGAIVNGDCAHLSGGAGDYAAFRTLLVDPMAELSLPLHLTLGNHDERDRFRAALLTAPGTGSGDVDLALPPHRHVSIVRGQHANWFLLDSLNRTNHKPGILGGSQIEWLSRALHELDDRPALVMAHHPIGFFKPISSFGGTLSDGAQLWSVLRSHAHVRAFVFGHTHRWNVTRRDGIYLVNLPATGYVFEPGQPKGWVEMSVGPRGADLRLHTIPGSWRVRPEARTSTLPWA